jgi:hypothetical protein
MSFSGFQRLQYTRVLATFPTHADGRTEACQRFYPKNT